mmetsp:Transcript_5140/g.14492  ORF Transcript_5140/g.14492 Transcript_5140/m.14492 type:complete len:211 (-) Transcript_5140:756-1388(-)
MADASVAIARARSAATSICPVRLRSSISTATTLALLLLPERELLRRAPGFQDGGGGCPPVQLLHAVGEAAEAPGAALAGVPPAAQLCLVHPARRAELPVAVRELAVRVVAGAVADEAVAELRLVEVRHLLQLLLRMGEGAHLAQGAPVLHEELAQLRLVELLLDVLPLVLLRHHAQHRVHAAEGQLRGRRRGDDDRLCSGASVHPLVDVD